MVYEIQVPRYHLGMPSPTMVNISQTKVRTQNENKLYMQHDSHFHNSHVGIMIGIQILSSFVNGVTLHHM
jgi:hypothetical protein